MLQSLSLWRELAHDMFSAQGEAPAGGGAGGSGGAGEAGGEGGWVEARGLLASAMLLTLRCVLNPKP